jgi:hypothetical protein
MDQGAIAMSESPAGTALHEQLVRWSAAGLINPEQAGQIESAEAAPVAAGTAHRRLPLVIEALGYLGAVIAITAGAIVLQHFWHNVPPSAQLAFAGVVAVVLLAIGAVLRTGGDPPLARLRNVLWLFSTISVAAFAAVLADQVWHLGGSTVGLLSEGAGTACGIALWWRTRSTLQHLAVFAGTAALVATAVDRIAPGASDWAPGLGIWVIAALWGIAVYRDYLVPRTAGFIAAGIGLLVGAQWVMYESAAGHVLAVGTVVGLLAAGVALRRVLLLGFGAVGAVEILPQTAIKYLPGSAAAALSVCAVGLVLLGIAIWLAKTRRTI